MRQIPPSEQDMKRLVSKKEKNSPMFGSQEDFFKSQVKNEELTGEHVWQITQNVRKVAQATIVADEPPNHNIDGDLCLQPSSSTSKYGAFIRYGIFMSSELPFIL